MQAAGHPGFPQHMQPGRFAPMQPVNAKNEQFYYVNSPRYWGQPKIDGNKLIVFATPTEVFYQSRQMKLNPAPNAGMDAALKSVANIAGSFILEGELTYFDARNKEHRTGAQALTANIEMGEPGRLPKMVYGVFACIWRENDELSNYGQMVDLGTRIAEMCRTAGSSIITPIYIARTTDEKLCLVADQQAHGREGEVWLNVSMPYKSGKDNRSDNFVRTKYLAEFEAIVTGFTPTTAEGHAFGAMCIQGLDGKDLGNVGTGFTREQKRRLLDRFQRTGPFLVNIICQGFTEDRKAWHARFDSIVE